MADISLSHLGIGFAETLDTREMMLDSRNDLALTANPLQNLGNCIWRRLMTPLGFYPEYPDYGSELYRLIGMGFVPEVLSLAEIFVVQSLMKDPRISTVTDVRVIPTDYRAIMIALKVKPVKTANVFIMTFDYFLEG